MRIKVRESLVFFFDTVENVNFTRSYLGRVTMKGAKEKFEESENPVNPVKVIYIKSSTINYEVDDDMFAKFLKENANVVKE